MGEKAERGDGGGGEGDGGGGEGDGGGGGDTEEWRRWRRKTGAAEKRLELKTAEEVEEEVRRCQWLHREGMEEP